MHQLRVRAAQASAFSLLVAPAICQAAEAPLTPARIFGDSAPLQKLIILFLVASIFATLALVAVRLVRGRGAGSTFVGGLRVGGVLVGALGATYSAMNGMVGIANVPITPTMKVLAPGIAESLFVFGLGVLAASIAVFAYGPLQARKETAALRA